MVSGLTEASSRPHLLSQLYDARPDRCRTCGRRFPPTEDGKKRKEKHLDWHFKTATRMAEAARRGQSRSWYVDERVCEISPFPNSSSNARRTGSAPESTRMAKLRRKMLQPTAKRSKKLMSRFRTMRPSALLHVQSARKSSKHLGQRMYRNSSGRTP